jgi:Aconitase family (aconitate hydratase)
MEFSGTALAPMNMDERMTICNMAVEAGAKNGCIAPDQTTFDYVDSRAPGYAYEAQFADSDAAYAEEFTFDVSKLEPLVAAPHSPDNRKTARECSDVKIDRVYIGSCTGALRRLRSRMRAGSGDWGNAAEFVAAHATTTSVGRDWLRFTAVVYLETAVRTSESRLHRLRGTELRGRSVLLLGKSSWQLRLAV